MFGEYIERALDPTAQRIATGRNTRLAIPAAGPTVAVAVRVADAAGIGLRTAVGVGVGPGVASGSPATCPTSN
jgi:hypothetical protein